MAKAAADAERQPARRKAKREPKPAAAASLAEAADPEPRRKEKKAKKKKKKKSRAEGPDEAAGAGTEAPRPGKRKPAAEPLEAAGAAPDMDSEAGEPFQADPADHCESPLAAYEDLRPLLSSLAKSLGKSEAELRIYDPYFCTGRVKAHLASLGFPRVRNRFEDFYAAVEAGAVPEFDVLVTNPPYTASAPTRPHGSIFFGTTDHVERLLRYSASCGKPCALLMPNYVYMKGYFAATVAEACRAAAVAPAARYTYEAPKLTAASHVHDAHGAQRNKKTKKTAPFVSFWYLLAPWGDKPWRAGKGEGCAVHALPDELPDNIRDATDPWRRPKPWWERAAPKVSRSGQPLCSACGQVHGQCKHTRG